MEEVAGKAHVDPGVAAAVQARQQHGDDEGHGCIEGQKKKRCNKRDISLPSALNYSFLHFCKKETNT